VRFGAPCRPGAALNFLQELFSVPPRFVMGYFAAFGRVLSFPESKRTFNDCVFGPTNTSATRSFLKLAEGQLTIGLNNDLMSKHIVRMDNGGAR